MIELKKEQIFIILIFLVIIIGGGGFYLGQNNYNQAYTETFVKENSYSNMDQEENTSSKNEKLDYIVVHIAGEIKKPGVYKVTEKSRVIDVLKLAGGESEIADLSGINLASEIKDGQKIVIPGLEANSGVNNFNNKDNNFRKNENSQSVTSSMSENKINLNIADIEDLKKLSGIGEIKAKNIIDHRESINEFTDINQLLDINGIGEKTLETIKDELTL